MLFSHVREDGTATFFYPHQDHRSVHVSGSFSGWQSPGHPLRRTEHGWVGEVSGIPAGDVEYKLVVDGRWLPDPLNLTRRPDGLGGENSLLQRGERRGSIHHLRFHSPALGEEPGVEDCRALARELGQRGVGVDHAEANGIHDWPTWRAALPAHLRFHWENVQPQ